MAETLLGEKVFRNAGVIIIPALHGAPILSFLERYCSSHGLPELRLVFHVEDAETEVANYRRLAEIVEADPAWRALDDRYHTNSKRRVVTLIARLIRHVERFQKRGVGHG